MRLCGCDETLDRNEWRRGMSDKRLERIKELVAGTIEHFDRDDAMDLLYQIKKVINEKT